MMEFSGLSEIEDNLRELQENLEALDGVEVTADSTSDTVESVVDQVMAKLPHPSQEDTPGLVRPFAEEAVRLRDEQMS